MKNGISDRAHAPIAMAPPATKNAFSYEPDSWKIKPKKQPRNKIINKRFRKWFREFADRMESNADNHSLTTELLLLPWGTFNPRLSVCLINLTNWCMIKRDFTLAREYFRPDFKSNQHSFSHKQAPVVRRLDNAILWTTRARLLICPRYKQNTIVRLLPRLKISQYQFLALMW